MIIVNPGNQDFHMHSLNFSDWLATIDEIVKFAWEVWLEKIAITDHSQALLDDKWFAKKSLRRICNRWRNVYNNVEVIFWVEWDILNEQWDICIDIQWVEWDFNILSLHGIYDWDIQNIQLAYENSIIRHHEKIDLIWHPCIKKGLWYVDMKRLCRIANEYNLPLEFDCAYLVSWKNSEELIKQMLEYADRIYVNSDAHTLYELKEYRKIWFQYLKDLWVKI